jgi:exodeoxyribonuclease III
MKALFRPEVREAYRRLVAQGWTDALRALHPDARIYTFWKYFRNAFARDAGLRIDHLLLSPSLAGRLVAAGVDRHVRAGERSSDQGPPVSNLPALQGHQLPGRVRSPRNPASTRLPTIRRMPTCCMRSR